jgi:hypothetical protein
MIFNSFLTNFMTQNERLAIHVGGWKGYSETSQIGDPFIKGYKNSVIW